MKNTVLLACLLLSLSASSQTILGIKGGLNVANFNGYSKLMDPRFGFHAGLFAQKPLKGKFSLQAELLYSQKGGREEVPIAITLTTIRWMRMHTNYAYLDLPVLVNYQLFKRFSPYVGPQLSLLVQKKADVKGIDNERTTISGQGRFQVGVVAGLGYQILEKLGADIRYSRGFAGNGLLSHVLQASITYRLTEL